MKTVSIYQENEPLASVQVADRFWSRFRGLMLRKSLPDGEGLLLKGCGSIHCCFMRFAIDAVYLDRELNVIGWETVRPWHLGGRYPKASSVLELAAGAAAGLRPGMRLQIGEVGI